MNAMEVIQKECCECGSRDTIITGDKLKCLGCGGSFVHRRKLWNNNGGEEWK